MTLFHVSDVIVCLQCDQRQSLYKAAFGVMTKDSYFADGLWCDDEKHSLDYAKLSLV